MYGFKITKEAQQKIAQLQDSKFSEGLNNKLLLLNENPKSRAKETNNNIFGKYYVNCGSQHCIVFDIDEENGLVLIYRVLRSAYLHKILVGWIDN